MEKYKKKSLNFMGFSRELRETERANKRQLSRHERFSIVRMIDNESMIGEKKEMNSKIPTIGKHKDQASSRTEMLQKWKQEKMVKKQQESKLKKPVFKVGVIKPEPLPSLGSKPLFVLDTSSRLFKSSFKGSNPQLSSRKQESLNASNKKTNAKVSNSQLSSKKQECNASNTKTNTKVCNSQTFARKPEVNTKINAKASQTSIKKPEVDTVNTKTSAKLNMKIQPPTSKIGVPIKPGGNLTKNKESGIQLFSMKSKVDAKPRVANKNQVSVIGKHPTIGSKPPLETYKESGLQPLNERSKVASSIKDAKSNILSFGSPKATASRTLSTESKQTIPKKNIAVKSIPKFSKTLVSQQKGNFTEKTSRFESEKPLKPQVDYQTNKSNEVATFKCELSRIEPDKEQRKSFAPPGFMFQPPVELNSSLFLEDGPSAIFLRMKNQFLRTSTPKQNPSSPQSNTATEDSECLENEVIKCARDEEKIEDSQCSTNAVNKLESSHKCDFDALLSSSLESVYLNDAKPVDCKRSLKFEFPEIVATQNQEDVFMSSKISCPELPLARDPTLSGAINRSILSDSIEIHKTEVNSTDTKTVDDSKIAIPFLEDDSVFEEIMPGSTNILKPSDFKQSLNCESLESVPTRNLEEILLSCNVEYPKHSVTSEPTSGREINSPILLDTVEIEKTEVNSTKPEDNKITVSISEDVPVVSEVIPNLTCTVPDDNTENIQNVFNGFLQKQGNSFHKIPEKKNRNFRRGEKPGLSSINESLENTPKSAMKRKDLDNVFTVRRSLRLAKLSGNFSSLENLVDTSKPKENDDKTGLKCDFTPRRSLRLSKFCTEFSSAENLFDVRRPTLYGTPEKDEVVPKLNSRVTYDFDKLSLETEEETNRHTAHGRKVSLLYTPNKSRSSIMRRSIKGDLMSFSPNA